MHRVAPEIDALADSLYEPVLGPWWPPERRHSKAGYRDIPFPFADIDTPEMVPGRRVDSGGMRRLFRHLVVGQPLLRRRPLKVRWRFLPARCARLGAAAPAPCAGR